MGAIKRMKPDYVIKAVVMIVIGIVLAVWTRASLDIMARALAALLFLIGAVFVITYLVKKERTFVISGGLVAGILIAAVGGWIFANPGKFTDFIPKLFGIFIMVSGLGNLWQAISLVKYIYITPLPILSVPPRVRQATPRIGRFVLFVRQWFPDSSEPPYLPASPTSASKAS